LQLERHLLKLGELYKRHKEVSLTTTFALLVGIAFIDYITGVDYSFSIFYLLPISLVAWYAGFGAGVIASAAGAVLWFIVDSVLGGHAYASPAAGYWNSLARFGFFIIVTAILSKLKRSIEATRSRTEALAAAYAQLDQAAKEQLIVKDQLLSHVSHELRTPLTSVHQFITILRDGVAGEIGKEQKDYLEIALKNINQLNKMIDDLLEGTRIDLSKLHFKPEPFRLAVVLDDLIQSLHSVASGKKISLTTAIAPNLPTLYADPDRVRQVLLNLLDNAIKFTPEGGAVRVKAGVYEQDPTYVCVAVSDTGPGIRSELQDRLFQRFYQIEDVHMESRKGLGLGLYISREIVSRHKGKIWVVSQPGSGSTFYLTLPAYSPCPPTAAPPGEGSNR
jgi:signal transduction histidine kinase